MNYVKGEELRKLMIDPKQTMLSKRGSVLLDSRSNIMIIKDTQKRIEDIRTMLAQIDIPLRQVMIEARIVEAGDSFAKNLGIRLSMGAVEVETKKDSNTNLLTYGVVIPRWNKKKFRNGLLKLLITLSSC